MVKKSTRQHFTIEWLQCQLDSSGNVSFSFNPTIGGPLMDQFIVCEGMLPTTSLNDVRQTQLLGHIVDICLWKGKKCIYTLVLFARVAKINRISRVPPRISRLHRSSCLWRYGICPVLIIVVDVHSSLFRGVLLLFLGPTFENRNPTFRDLKALVEIVDILYKVDVMHGDICIRISVLMETL